MGWTKTNSPFTSTRDATAWFWAETHPLELLDDAAETE